MRQTACKIKGLRLHPARPLIARKSQAFIRDYRAHPFGRAEPQKC